MARVLRDRSDTLLSSPVSGRTRPSFVSFNLEERESVCVCLGYVTARGYVCSRFENGYLVGFCVAREVQCVMRDAVGYVLWRVCRVVSCRVVLFWLRRELGAGGAEGGVLGLCDSSSVRFHEREAVCLLWRGERG
jgi:hypothetical protein